MLSLLTPALIAQVTYAPVLPEQGYIVEKQDIRGLPGALNNVLVFNSNSPEIIKTEGILLSTFPNKNKDFPSAHLNQALSGRFDLFSHHISRPVGGARTLYQGVLIYNPTNRPVRVRVLQAGSYLTSPDAPFIDLPSKIEDPNGKIFSGPGSRLTGAILRGETQPIFRSQIVLLPQQSQMLFSLPITPSNGRSTFMRLETDGKVYLANLAKYAIAEYPTMIANQQRQQLLLQNEKTLALPQPVYREPVLREWISLLVRGQLVRPRDLPPTPVASSTRDTIIYGRVAGVSVGSEWIGRVTDKPGSALLTIPEEGQAFSYPLSTVDIGTHGTRQVQSAPMLVRYPDTAFRAHGNYGVHYNFTLPLHNNETKNQVVTVRLQTPVKQDQYTDRLFFFSRPQGQIFFRGVVRATYRDDWGQEKVHYYHLVQHQGQQGEPLIKINLRPGETREVNLDFLYPPDATPPQVLTVKTENSLYPNNRYLLRSTNPDKSGT
jgi:hypothetical protein